MPNIIDEKPITVSSEAALTDDDNSTITENTPESNGSGGVATAAPEAPTVEDVLAKTEFIADGDIDEWPDSVEQMDYTHQYSDEYYEHYISNFEQNTRKRYFFRFVKRSFDLVASALALLVLSPLLLGCAIAVKCDSKGPVIFRQPRVGKNGKVFNCLKFRSMRTDAPKNAPTSLLEHPEDYYTKVGRFLRRTSLDELPQLWCVFIGKMSIIGYRPLVPNEAKANMMRERLGVFAMRPGISGYAQVKGRDDVYYKNKALLDAEYVKRASLLFDLKILFGTFGVVLFRKGNNSDKTTGKISCDEKKTVA